MTKEKQGTREGLLASTLHFGCQDVFPVRLGWLKTGRTHDAGIAWPRTGLAWLRTGCATLGKSFAKDQR